MAKRLTVFYSWQSDAPPSLNRNFIEKALTEALVRLRSDAALEPAFRDTQIELDKDTKGVAGSPPIADTILRKVEECAVFVADLTFVGQSKEGFTNAAGKFRQFPNPNVLMEYGYALRCHDHTKVVGVMNTAYGKPDADSLPFDLRHLRWPITYHLAETEVPDRAKQFEKLVSVLVEAIGLILSEHSAPVVMTERFAPLPATSDAATFYADRKGLVPEQRFGQQSSLEVPEGAKAYLRVSPVVTVPPLESELEAKNLIVSGGLRPFGEVGGWDIQRNTFGAIVFQTARDKKLYNFSQLFLSREIWGVEARILNADYHRELHAQWGIPADHNWIASEYVEKEFTRALQNYLALAERHLLIPSPVRVEAGLVGVKGYAIATNPSRVTGRALHSTTQWQGEADYKTASWQILAPFFRKMWANCDVIRPATCEAELIRTFQTTR